MGAAVPVERGGPERDGLHALGREDGTRRGVDARLGPGRARGLHGRAALLARLAAQADGAAALLPIRGFGAVGGGGCLCGRLDQGRYEDVGRREAGEFEHGGGHAGCGVKEGLWVCEAKEFRYRVEEVGKKLREFETGDARMLGARCH